MAFPALETLFEGWFPKQSVWIGLSGGIDSVVLLHLAVRFLKPRGVSISVVHVNHHLSAESGAWTLFCEDLARTYQVPFQLKSLEDQPQRGDSVEAWAREGRYQAFSEVLGPEDILLTAQHADDQLETVLLQLLRGAGVAGLAAMPVQAKLGQGYLHRPLLSASRADIQAYAEAYQLRFIHDDSNASTRFNRNYLRHEVLPKIYERWPAAASTVSRSAENCAEALRLFSPWVKHLAQCVVQGKDFNLTLWAKVMTQAPWTDLDLSPSDQALWLKAVLREWLRNHHGLELTRAHLTVLLHEVIGAQKTAKPRLKIQSSWIIRDQDCLQVWPIPSDEVQIEKEFT